MTHGQLSWGRTLSSAHCPRNTVTELNATSMGIVSYMVRMQRTGGQENVAPSLTPLLDQEMSMRSDDDINGTLAKISFSRSVGRTQSLVKKSEQRITGHLEGMWRVKQDPQANLVRGSIFQLKFGTPT